MVINRIRASDFVAVRDFLPGIPILASFWRNQAIFSRDLVTMVEFEFRIRHQGARIHTRTLVSSANSGARFDVKGPKMRNFAPAE